MKKASLFLATGLLTNSHPIAADLIFSEYVEGSSFNKVLEIYNPTNQTVNLADYSLDLFSNGNSVANSSYTLSGALQSEQVFVIAHPSATASILAIADDTSGVVNFNGNDTVTLSKNGNIVDSIGQVGFNPGSEWGAGDISTQNNTIRRITTVVSGDTIVDDPFDPSVEWLGFSIDTFDDLGFYGETQPPMVTSLTIPEIQGVGHQSMHQGETIQTSGIVTAVDSRGFYLQDAEGDGHSNSSDAIFVFTSSAPNVDVGDEIDIEAIVSEYTPGGSQTNNLSITQLISPEINVVSSGNELPLAVVIGDLGISPPTTIIDNDQFSAFDPSEDGIDFYETLEAMRVTVIQPVAVSPTNRFNETFVLADNGNAATGQNSRSGIAIAADDFNPERIQLQIDADILADFELMANVGDRFSDATGVMSYAFGNFELILTEPVSVISSQLTAQSSDLLSDEQHLTIASYNVQNLDPIIENIDLVGGSRDIDDDIGDGKFAAIAEQIVNSLHSPNIIALQEMQDSDGAQQTDVVDANLTANVLIEAILEAGGSDYEYVEIAPVNNTDGGQPGGNIRVGYLYNPAIVQLNEQSVHKIEDQDLTDGDAFENTRKSLYASFTFNGQIIHIINNHWSSKGGSSPLFGALQPPINGRVEMRNAQAQVINQFIDQLLVEDSDANIVVLGDLNEFYFEQPLLTLQGEEPILFNLAETVPAEEIYSYIFQGNSQALDHALVSASLVDRAEFDMVHTNAEFYSQASDHDPLLLRLDFGNGVPTIETIKDYFKKQVVAGTLVGFDKKGRPAKAYRNLLKFSWQIIKIERAIEQQKTKKAKRLLTRAINKSDGIGRDWVQGESLGDLNQMLLDLRQAL